MHTFKFIKNQRTLLWVFGLASVVSLCYYPAWNGTPIWDDNHHITKPEMRSMQGLDRVWTELGATQQYYPLVHTTFWLLHRVWGDASLGYHLFNILLHILSALLIISILRFLKIPGALLAGTVWALHPIQVESVAWISELKNVLSGVFFFSTGLFYLKFDRDRKNIHFVIAICLFICGLLSKSVIAMLPVALITLFWWQRGTIAWKRDILPLIPFFVLGIIYGLFTAWVERKFIGAEGNTFYFSIMERCLIAGRVVWFYLAKIIWPVDLIFIYPRWDVNQAIWWQYLFPLAALLLAVLLWVVQRKIRSPLAAFVFYIAMLFPVMGFFNVYPFRFSFVADHFQYLAALGPLVVICAAIDRSAGYLEKKGMKFIKPVISLVLIVTLGTLTWFQSGMYTGAETLYRTTIQKNSNCWMAYNNLGVLLMGENKPREAIENYTKALILNSGYAEAHNNLGNAFLTVDQQDKAFYHFKKALELNPDYAGAHNNLGLLLMKTGRIDDAVVQFNKSIESDPSFSEAWNNLGNALIRNGRLMDAVHCFKKAVSCNPFYAAGYGNMGIAVEKTGNQDEAIALYEKAISLDPGSWEIRFNLANSYMKKGRLPEAISSYIKITKDKPGFAEAWSNLGNALRQSGQLDEALACYEKALEINPKKINTMINRAGVLAQLNRKSDAITLLNQARDLAASNGDMAQSNEIERHLSVLKQ